MDRLQPVFLHYPKGTWALGYCASYWCPAWLAKSIVIPFNWLVCRLQGHMEIGWIGNDSPPCTHCMNCSKEVRPCSAISCTEAHDGGV